MTPAGIQTTTTAGRVVRMKTAVPPHYDPELAKETLQRSKARRQGRAVVPVDGLKKTPLPASAREKPTRDAVTTQPNATAAAQARNGVETLVRAIPYGNEFQIAVTVRVWVNGKATQGMLRLAGAFANTADAESSPQMKALKHWSDKCKNL